MYVVMKKKLRWMARILYYKKNKNKYQTSKHVRLARVRINETCSLSYDPNNLFSSLLTPVRNRRQPKRRIKFLKEI